MGDLPPKLPDYHIQQDKINNPPIEHRLEEYPKISQEVGGFIIEVKDWVVKVFKKGEISGETKKETNELSDEFKKQFIEKLKLLFKNNLDYKDDIKLKKAIETGTIEIRKVPGRNLMAISLDGTNFDGFYNFDGTEYFEMYQRRENEFKYRVFNSLIFKRHGFQEIEKSEGIFVLTKGGKELINFSDEYYTEFFKYLDEIVNLKKKLDEMPFKE